MKFLKRLAKAAALVASTVLMIGSQTFASDTDNMPGFLEPGPSLVDCKSFGSRRQTASVTPDTWPGPKVKYTVHPSAPGCYNINCDGKPYISVQVIPIDGVARCYSVFGANVKYRIYELAGGSAYKIVSDDPEIVLAQMTRSADGNWVITRCLPEGELLNSWAYTVRPYPHRPNANEIVREIEHVTERVTEREIEREDGQRKTERVTERITERVSKVVSTVITSGLDSNIKNVILLLAGIVLN